MFFGEGGIRTLGTREGTRDFQSRTLSHSATPPVGHTSVNGATVSEVDAVSTVV